MHNLKSDGRLFVLRFAGLVPAILITVLTFRRLLYYFGTRTIKCDEKLKLPGTPARNFKITSNRIFALN